MRETPEGFTRDTGSRFHKRSGFTVIELLVVVLIIAALITVMLPTIRGSREHAQLAVCASTQKNFGHDTMTFMMDNAKRYPNYSDFGTVFTASELRCANDFDPLYLAAGSVGNANTLVLSYAINGEYNSDPTNIYNLDRTPSPASKAMYYDGGRSGSDILVPNGPGKAKSAAGSANKGKDGNVNIIHKPNTPAQQDKNIPMPALGGHMGHGDLFGISPSNGSAPTIANMAQDDFNPRHPVNADLGNILFADSHVASYKAMTDSMFLFP